MSGTRSGGKDRTVTICSPADEDSDWRIYSQVSRMTSGEGSRVAEFHANLNLST